MTSELPNLRIAILERDERKYLAFPQEFDPKAKKILLDLATSYACRFRIVSRKDKQVFATKISPHKEKWYYLYFKHDKFHICSDICKALTVKLLKARPIHRNSVQIKMCDKTCVLVFEQDLFVPPPEPLLMEKQGDAVPEVLPFGEVTCPGNPTTSRACQSIPNAVWVSATGNTPGSCHCCTTNGSAWADSSSPALPCQSCAGEPCGGGGGFCRGDTNNSSGSCAQDPNTLKWSTRCDPTGRCNGNCPGSCGAAEWFAFHRCKQANNGFDCVIDLTQWRSWILYGGIVLAIAIFILLITLVK